MKSSLVIFIILFFISLKIFAVPNDVNRSNVTDAITDPTNTFVLTRPNLSGTLAITADVLPFIFTTILNPNGLMTGHNYMSQTYDFQPLQNSPDESWNILKSLQKEFTNSRSTHKAKIKRLISSLFS